MAQREELQSLFEDIIGRGHVYFQPPPSVKISYPCIIYQRSGIDTDFANNNIYAKARRYMVTLIDRNPDSIYIDKILELPKCAHDRFYVADNLNHDVFTIYY